MNPNGFFGRLGSKLKLKDKAQVSISNSYWIYNHTEIQDVQLIFRE